MREYPTRGLFAHPIGYSFIQNGRRGLEQSRNDELAGKENEFSSIFAGLEGRDAEGNDVVTNLDVNGTNAAVQGLAGRKGAVVAIEPQDRQGARDGVDPGVRPEPDPDRLPGDQRRPELSPTSTAPRRSATRRARPSRW